VELALVLPLLAGLLLGLVQIGLLVRDQVLVVHAAREAVRAAAVREAGVREATVREGPSQNGPDTARNAALAAVGSTLEPDRLRVDLTEGGGRVSVRVGYRDPIRLPLLRVVARDVRLAAYAEARREID
jgi:Flp pilus assembly protein TadG